VVNPVIEEGDPDKMRGPTEGPPDGFESISRRFQLSALVP
jgi:hypothetical protein